MCFSALAQCFALIETRATAVGVNTFAIYGEVVQHTGAINRRRKAEPAEAPERVPRDPRRRITGHAQAPTAAVIENLTVCDVLMDAARVCLLGQITNTLFEVGGQYSRNM